MVSNFVVVQQNNEETELSTWDLEALPAFVLETVCLNRLSFWSYVDGTGLIM